MGLRAGNRARRMKLEGGVKLISTMQPSRTSITSRVWLKGDVERRRQRVEVKGGGEELTGLESKGWSQSAGVEGVDSKGRN